MNVKKIIGWVLSILIAAMMIFLSAPGKFMDFEGKEEMFAKLGWGVEVMKTIGVIEIVVAVLYLIPRTAFVGAVLVTAYLGGAIATHVRINDQFIFPVIMGVIAWIALGLRDGRIFTAAFTAPPKPLAD
ncbi:DoxX family protein [Lacipirellula sp.]|uniref:DoxX family protein n=1 Tax=Lacipirellula sp. TaxID=2691419 RepID=UPI003D0B4458